MTRKMIPFKRLGPLAVAMVLGISTGPRFVSAQIPGLPEQFYPNPRNRVTLVQDVTFACRPFVGMHAVGRVGRLGLMGGLGLSTRDDRVAAGGKLGYRLGGIEGCKWPVDVEGGAGYASLDAGSGVLEREWRFPLGVGLGREIEIPGIDLQPWLGVRLENRLITLSSDDIGWRWEHFLAVSGGAGVTFEKLKPNFLSGLGFHVAVDWTRKDGHAALADRSARSILVSGLLQWRFRPRRP